MDTKTQILNIAQRLVQQRGFNGFSYADIAQEVGIRKASLHHHFPSKAELGIALVDYYAMQFDEELERINLSHKNAVEKIAAYITAYRASLEKERMCMCGMLATEILTLDATMLPKLQRFFVRNTEWLAEVMTEGKAQAVLCFEGSATDHARMVLATLQGASLVCRTTEDLDAFDRTTSLLVLVLGFKSKISISV